MTYCLGRCSELKAPKPPDRGRYAAGQKRCNFCGVFMTYEGMHCTCCGRQLRHLPRSKKGKEKYHREIVA